MAKKHKPEEIVAKLRQVDVLTSQGMPIADAIRSIGVTEVTYYRGRRVRPKLLRPAGASRRSGMMMPPEVFDSLSTRRNATRS
jgi:hypothetical protein